MQSDPRYSAQTQYSPDQYNAPSAPPMSEMYSDPPSYSGPPSYGGPPPNMRGPGNPGNSGYPRGPGGPGGPPKSNNYVIIGLVVLVIIILIVIIVLATKKSSTGGTGSGGGTGNTGGKQYKLGPWVVNTVDGKIPTCGKGTITKKRKCLDLTSGAEVDIVNCRTYFNNSALPFIEESTIDRDCPTPARYVRFERETFGSLGNDWDKVMHISEMEIYDEFGQVLSKPSLVVTAGSTVNAVDKPANILDGDSNTYWHSDLNKNIETQWIMVDLGSIKNVGKVKIINVSTPEHKPRITGCRVRLLKGPSLAVDTVYLGQSINDNLIATDPSTFLYDTMSSVVIQNVPI